MTTRAESIPRPNFERVALDYALSQLLSDDAKQVVFHYLETKHKITMNGNTPLTSKEVATVLDAFFGTGGMLILDQFYKKLAQLRTQ